MTILQLSQLKIGWFDDKNLTSYLVSHRDCSSYISNVKSWPLQLVKSPEFSITKNKKSIRVEGILPNNIHSYPSLNVDCLLASCYIFTILLNSTPTAYSCVSHLFFFDLIWFFFSHPLILSLSQGTVWENKISQAPLHLISC